MSKLKEVFYVLSKVYKDWQNIFLTFIIAVLFYFLNCLIFNIGNISSLYSSFTFITASTLLFESSINYGSLVLPFTLFSTIILGALLGVLISLLVYRFKKIDKKDKLKLGIAGSVGVFLGVAIPGCAACGVGLLSVLGLSSSLLALPFEGKEITLLAVILVIFSIINLAGKLYNPLCRLNLVRNQNMKGGKNE